MFGTNVALQVWRPIRQQISSFSVLNADAGGVYPHQEAVLRRAVETSGERPSLKEIELLIMGEAGEIPKALMEQYPHINAALEELF